MEENGSQVESQDGGINVSRKRVPCGSRENKVSRWFDDILFGADSLKYLLRISPHGSTMDLDDFFAKKDRKKSKGKKFATADEIAKKLEESGRRSEKLKKEKKEEVDEQGNTVVQDEDEWREFEEEKKDYSGLKIHNLTLSEYDNWEEGGSGGEDEEGGMEENEQGEMVPKKKAGPWRVIQNPAPAAAEEEPAPVTAATTQPQTPQQPSSTYVPPSLRNATRTPTASATPFNQRLMRRKVAPDVRSEEAFPTLSAATAQEAAGASAWSKNRKTNQELGFEEVRNSKSHSGRSVAAQSTVSLGNKYGALEADQS